MVLTLVERLLTRRGDRDGASAALEQPVTGIPSALLDAAAEAPAPAQKGRRDRPLGTGRQVMVDAMAAKVLHGWLQNRHQTLFPLALNLRTLQQAEAVALVRWMAVAVLAASQPRPGAAREWLAGVGAGPDTLAALDAALADPPPLHAALRAVSRDGLSAYAYVVAVVALTLRDAAGGPFLDYIAARLALPTEVVRSANRRYGS